MFDDLKNDNENFGNLNNSVNSNPINHDNIANDKVQQPVEDIFASTSKSSKVPLSTTPLGEKKIEQQKTDIYGKPLNKPNVGLEGLQTSPHTLGLNNNSNGKKTFYKILLFIIILAILAVIGWLIYDGFLRKSKIKDNKVNNEQVNEKNIDDIEEDYEDNYYEDSRIEDEDNKNIIDKPNPKPVVKDTDNDGLSDAEEATWGTDKNKPDTDGDGLFDREEVMIYKTNPLIVDSDNDGYSDGVEVKNGYNPNGSGKLFVNN